MTRLIAISSFLVLIAANSAFADAQTSVTAIAKERIGEFVTITGAVSDFKASQSDRAPHAFNVRDRSGAIRVCVWPDIYKQITNTNLLPTAGTSITLTAQVSEYREKIELHVANPEEVIIGVKPPADAVSTASAVDQP